jgi:hypothetical protein
MIKVCPVCKGIVHYNSHFKAYMCLSPQCTWMEEKEQHFQMKQIKKFLVRRTENESKLVMVK